MFADDVTWRKTHGSVNHLFVKSDDPCWRWGKWCRFKFAVEVAKNFLKPPFLMLPQTTLRLDFDVDLESLFYRQKMQFSFKWLPRNDVTCGLRRVLMKTVCRFMKNHRKIMSKMTSRNGSNRKSFIVERRSLGHRRWPNSEAENQTWHCGRKPRNLRHRK